MHARSNRVEITVLAFIASSVIKIWPAIQDRFTRFQFQLLDVPLIEVPCGRRKEMISIKPYAILTLIPPRNGRSLNPNTSIILKDSYQSADIETRSRGIYISTTSILLPCHIDAACIPPDEALSVDYTLPPDTPSPPIFQLSAMKRIYMPGFAGAVSVVKVDKSQLVYKRLVLTSEADKDVKLERRRRDILQCELDVYSRLHGSPYVLPIIGLVERVRHFVVYDDPHTKDVPVTDGFLIPFVGIFSQWCPGFCTEWTIQEKEFLALTLMDALLDFEQRGVHTTDLKNKYPPHEG
ncbi:hypothetical protein EV421DRAFT_2018554, partial [Armillaria borealis]